MYGEISELIVGEDYRITVRFDNSHSVTIDMEKKQHTARFSELRNEQAFRAATTEGKANSGREGFRSPSDEIVEFLTK